MAEPKICEFTVPLDAMTLITKCNGDIITIGKTISVHLGQEPASNLAWLINNDSPLHVEIKQVVE